MMLFQNLFKLSFKKERMCQLFLHNSLNLNTWNKPVNQWYTFCMSHALPCSKTGQMLLYAQKHLPRTNECYEC